MKDRDPLAEYEAANPHKHHLQVGNTMVTGRGPTPKEAEEDAKRQAEMVRKGKSLPFSVPIKIEHSKHDPKHLPWPRMRQG